LPGSKCVSYQPNTNVNCKKCILNQTITAATVQCNDNNNNNNTKENRYGAGITTQPLREFTL